MAPGGREGWRATPKTPRIALDRRTRTRVKTFLRNAEMEIKALQKELDRYHRPATKADVM
jgi:hypothetical protein